MKEQQSHMNIVARFAYIFATIVTVFAQMGAAVPALIAEADSTPTGLISTEGMTMSKPTIDGFLYTVTISGKEPADGQSFKVKMLGTGLVLNDTATDKANGSGTSGSTYNSIRTFSGWRVVNNGDNTLTVTRDDDYKDGSTGLKDTFDQINTTTPWPMKISFLLDKDNPVGGVELDGSDTPIVVGETNSLALSVFNNGPTTYQVGDEVDLQVSDQKMITGGEVDVNKETVSPYLKFDFDKTAALLKKEGYTQSDGDSTELSKLAGDSGSTKNYKFTKSDGTYFYLLDNGGDARIAWPDSTGTKQRTALIAMDAVEQTSSVSLTPNYLSTSLKGQDGTGIKLTIQAPPEVDGTGLRLDPHSVANDGEDGGKYNMSTFPLFYMKETDDKGTQLYSFIYNHSSTGHEGGGASHSLEELRKAILSGAGYGSLENGGAGSTTSTEPAFFENFHEIGSDGYAVAGSEKKFDVDKTYTLIPYNPLTAGSDRFKRINTKWASKDYYMPDGVPTFSVDASGNITLKSTGDGKAVTDQWSATGKTINAALYKVKKLKVVDQNGDPVSDAKLTLKNADGKAAFMQATTASDGTGEFLPNDYGDANKGPFYYADGAQAFDKLTLPSGYSQDVGFSSMTISKADDTLSLSADKKNAAISADGQTLTLTVHKYDAKDTDITINKVAKADTSKNLGGATLHVEEVDGASDAIATKDVKTQASDGLATLTVDATSATTKRIFHVTETQAPDGYLIANKNGYYATWTKGSGFTDVGDTQDATGTESADGLATIKDGKLVIQDPDAYNAGGADSKMRIQYVDSAEYLKPGSGTKIAGAQLPVLKENETFAGTGLAGFSGLGGVIYNPDTDPSTLMKADAGIASGTLAHNSSMYTSLEKSGTDGIGIVQGLWSQTGLVYGWEGLDHNTNGWILSNAVVSGTIPKSPAIQYQLISPAQRQRAVATPASGYYNLGSTLVLSGNGKILTVKNASGSAKYNNAKDRDNPVPKADTDPSSTAQVELYKVKHVRVVDTAGNKVPNAVVKFLNMTGTTGSDGSDGELLPNDVNNQPTTKGDNFVFPDAVQTFKSVTDAADKVLTGSDGKALDSKNGFSFDFNTGGVDTLRQRSAGSGVSIQDSGQTIQITVKAPTTIKIHKQDFVHPDKAVAGATFKVWADGDDANAVTTKAATDDNGDTSVTLANASANDTYHIQEVKAPDGYTLDKTDYTFTWTPKTGVSAVKDTTSHVMASDGVLHFADLKTGGGGVGDNGTNGGTLTIHKVDSSDASAMVPDGAQFTLTQTMGGSSSDTQTTSDGKVSFNVGEPTTTDKVFKITETRAPKGYAKAANSYLLRIQADGTMTLGSVDMLNTQITADYTEDNVIKFTSSTDHSLVFGDTKDTNNNGGLFSLKKIDSSNAAVTPPDGAKFQLVEQGTNAFAPEGSTVNGLISFDLGTPTTTTRKFTLYEQRAPLGYVLNTQAYTIAISATGVVSVGSGEASTNPTLSTTQTSDKAVTVVGKGVSFADDPVTTQNNGGMLTIKKVDASDRTQGLQGAMFGGSESVNNDINFLGTDAGVTSDARGNFSLNLGQPTNTTRTIALQEATAPSGYDLNGKKYWFKIDPSGTIKVVGLTADQQQSNPSNTTPDGVVQVDANNQVTFSDTLTPVASSFTIKKTALSDRKTAITTNLNGASFKASEIMLSGETALGDFALQSSGSTNPITTSKSSNRLRLVKIQETKAPTGYALSTKPYYVTLSATGGVVGVSQDDSTSTDQKSADSVVQVDDKNTVNFGDAVKQNSFSIKKTDASDPTKGVTGNATFEVHRLDATTRKPTSDVYTVKTTDGTVTATNLSDQSLSDGYFSIQEKSAPSGYDLEKNVFYFKWNADQGITALAGPGNETTNYTATKLNGAAGQQAVSIDNGVLNYSDVQKAGPVLTLKKVLFGTSTGLAGATFKVTDVGNGNLKTAPASGDTRGSTVTPLSETTGSDGTQKFSITPTPSGVLQRVFEVVETKAPDGYVLNSTPYYVGWSDRDGVNGVSLNSVKTVGFTASADQVIKQVPKSGTTLGYATIGDKSAIYNIAAVQRTATASDSGKPVGNVSITLSSPTGTSGTAQTLTTDATSGSVNVSQDVIAKALGLTTDQMKGNVDLRMDVSNTSNLTSPVSRIIRYTFPTSTGGGFSIYGGAAGTSSDALKQNDGMVEDSQTDKTLTAGNLDLLLRKDTLNANAIDDTNTVGTGLAGVGFTMTFKVNGKSYSKQVTTGTNGQLVLPDPNTLLGVKDLIAPSTPAEVTITQTTPFSGYATNPNTATLLYQPGTGYYSITGNATSENGTLTMTQQNGGIDSIKSILYYFGDSSINFYLTKEIDSLNLDSVPDSMNFGQVEAQSQAHDYPLLTTTDDNQAVFDTSTIGLTDSNVATSETNGMMSAQVTQQGTYADGWQLQLAVGDLTSEDQSDVVKNGNITFSQAPTILRDDQDANIANAGLSSAPSLEMGSTNPIDMLNTGANAQAGVYKINMNVADVSMKIPSYSGVVNKNYQAPMTWTVNDTPTQ